MLGYTLQVPQFEKRLIPPLDNGGLIPREGIILRLLVIIFKQISSFRLRLYSFLISDNMYVIFVRETPLHDAAEK